VHLADAPGDSLPFHPLANVFPLLEGVEFDALVNDIRTHGLLEPIWLYHGEILDGRNRYRACQQLGIPCASRIYDGNDPVRFVLSTNLRRRHLSESQRALVAAKLATLGQGERADRVDAHMQASTVGQGRPVRPANLPVLTQEQASELLNVAERTVRDARKVHQAAAPEVMHAVEAGELTVSAAQALIAVPRDAQAAVLAEVRHQAEGKALTAPRVKAAVQAVLTPAAPRAPTTVTTVDGAWTTYGPPAHETQARALAGLLAGYAEDCRRFARAARQAPLDALPRHFGLSWEDVCRTWLHATPDVVDALRCGAKVLGEDCPLPAERAARVRREPQGVDPAAAPALLDHLEATLDRWLATPPVPSPAPPDVGRAYWASFDPTTCLVGAVCAREHIYPYAAGPDGQPGSLRYRRATQECVVCHRLKQRRYRARQPQARKAKAKARGR
jgi:ParB-like chromosome segregation protein Spo0J